MIPCMNMTTQNLKSTHTDSFQKWKVLSVCVCVCACRLMNFACGQTFVEHWKLQSMNTTTTYIWETHIHIYYMKHTHTHTYVHTYLHLGCFWGPLATSMTLMHSWRIGGNYTMNPSFIKGGWVCFGWLIGRWVVLLDIIDGQWKSLGYFVWFVFGNIVLTFV